MPASDRKLRFSFLLMGILFAIIATIVLAGIWASYETSRSHLVENADLLRGLTEAHINSSFHLVDTGLKHYDSTYNDEMEDAFVLVMEEYRRAGGEPAAMDLAGLRSRTGMDVFVIDDTNTVAYTTKLDDLGLDFRAIYPDFSAYLDGIRNQSGFFPDRVTEDWSTRRMTKWGYMPTPDHRFILELGLSSEPFADIPMRLRYTDVVDEACRLNPYLAGALLFQKQKRLVNDSTYVPTSEEDAMLEYLLWQNRTTQVVTNASARTTTVWLPVDLRDPDYSADVSVFAKLTYDDGLLAATLARLAALYAFAGLLVLLSGGLLAALVSRRVSRPIEQIAADVDAVASGDLDHQIQPVDGYELNWLAEKTGVMVGRLRDQVRQREASEQRFTDLVRLLPLGVFETDLEGTVTFANPAALDAFGFTAADLERGIPFLSVIAPGEREQAAASFGGILADRRDTGSEFTGLRAGGSTFPMLVYASARCEDGAVAGVRGSFVDVGRIKQVEADLRRLNEELEERVAARTRELESFTYSVSHDLRAPLRAIDGYSALLATDLGPGLAPADQHYLEEVRRTVRQMGALIDGLLAL